MNVLMICTEKLPVPNIRGGAIQTYIGGVAPQLGQHHRLTILGRTDPELPDAEIVDGIRYVRVPSDGLFEQYAEGVIGFLSQQGEHYDIIHIFNRPRLVLPVRSVAPASRIILSMHNDMFHPAKIHPEEGSAAVEQTERIITISNYIGQQIVRYHPHAAPKLRTIYSGVDLSLFAPWMESDYARNERNSLRAQNQLESKKVILFVGRLSRNKGPHVLVKAMSHLKHSDAALVVVGGAWYSDNKVSDYIAYVRALAARCPLPVITTGYVQSGDIHRWFSAADVFVCTSLWDEPLARVHYEAMAAGLPFLTTARGGNPEVLLNDNGLLIADPENPLEYAEKLNHLLSNMEASRQMGLRGRRLAEQRFIWPRVAQEILEVWNGQ
ncbi:glycosyltransferase family 4 protein [Paenibacillus melissococcoides]|uniref:Glycosyltransferase family 4 protein n=1 Tax=Paenibacillus melissococcoides TaxID=2912268 RepID=A0ABM9G7N5_9BACL|nr:MULTISPECIES: glycosyltransferase family 4 protein [Paenibacillus]MEB9894058.1 glycosyltransferase family 4 protein [Bacillus cereus]CAH8247237.1 glycosyltransferase family 4 protein [Paenibacillus melissococcoides]CAH8717112.1 glycosyltransferase family 4 protein [Paenibacillus melissococcoides]CAH8718100.1 glycosyltransferase family 4 protein [Paenibacillus melissococcoides]GIO79251.1 spore coat protein SA [Paenibacillus dendritiformis]